MTVTDAPPLDVVEISVFGNGDGECLVVHVGDGNWIVVDSLMNGDQPVALAYLRHLEVDLDDVRLVVATHYHSDHIHGLARVLAACRQARWVTSSAICEETFRVAVRASAPPAVPEVLSGPLAEHRALLDIADGRGRPAEPVYAANSRSELWPEHVPRTRPTALRSLSPNDWVVRQTLKKVIASAGPGGRPGRVDHNATSIVLWLTTGFRSILLGGDQMRGGRGRTGWSAILAADVPAGRRSELYKVAHHGSERSDRDEIWTQLLTDDVRTAITAKHDSSLPREAMLARFVDRTPHVHVAGVRRDESDAADALSAEFGAVEALTGPLGHLRYRAPRGGNQARWQVRASAHTFNAGESR